MNKDLQLKKNETHFIFLVCGDEQTGKKTIVNNFLQNYNLESKEDKITYTSYRFHFDYSNQDETLSIPAEIRVLNSEEFSSDLKSLKQFYEGALGAFVVVSLEDFKYFTDGIKWKENIVYMCCLPNKFPLPIVLLINKCDKIEETKRREWIEKLNIESYYKENQFFAKFYLNNSDSIHTEKKIMKDEDEEQNNKEEEIYTDMRLPFSAIYNFVLEFGDIKSMFFENGNGTSKKKVDNGNKKKDCIIF